MKRVCVGFLAVLLVCTCLTGCGDVKQTNESLSIYFSSNVYAGTAALYRQIESAYQEAYPEVEVSEYQFEGELSLENEAKKLQSDMMTGHGPDVILDDGSLFTAMGMDVFKMAKGKAFWDMGPRLAEDPDWAPEKYRTTVLDAGKVGDRQYLMPLNYLLMVLVSTEEALSAAGFDPEKAATLAGYQQAGAAALDNGVTLYNDCQWNTLYYHTYNEVSETFILPRQFPGLVDNDKLLLDLERPQFREAVELWKQEWKAEEPLPRRDYSSSEAFSMVRQGKTLLGISEEPSVIFGSLAMLGSFGTPELLPLINETGGVTARVFDYACINASSPNRENAYQFIKIALGEELQKEAARMNLPVLRSMEALAVSTQWNIANGMKDYGDGLYGPIPEDSLTEYLALLDRVDSAVLDTSQYTKVLAYFEPYLRGERSYDQCLEDARSYYTIYATE